MAKLLYSTTMSVDGFIAGPGGDMSWLTEHVEPNPVLDDLVTSSLIQKWVIQKSRAARPAPRRPGLAR